MNLNENRLLMILADYVMQNVPIIIEYDSFNCLDLQIS